MEIRAIPLAAALLAGLPAMAASWKVQYFHDADNSSLEFRDMSCLSTTQCLAVGVLDQEGKQKGTTVVTNDGGAHWSEKEIKELPYSLFFLNNSLGWMVTDKGIWRTEEAGAAWTKLKNLHGIERVWFTSESHGWAIGASKTILETSDGGKEWTKLPVAEQVQTRPADTVYEWIVFADPEHGFITGSADPFHPGNPAEWANVPNVVRQQGARLVSIVMETTDAGRTWKPIVLQTNGRITRLRIAGAMQGLALFEFPPASQQPSGVFRLDLSTRRFSPVFEPKQSVARDVQTVPGGESFVAAVELQGQTSAVPIPGKLKMFSSRNGESAWVEEHVDYRAEARQPVIAAADSLHVWVATDTGMILMRQ